MKKTIAVLIAAMIAVALLSGFQLADMEEPSAEPTGTWYLQKMKQGDMEMDAELIASMSIEMVLTIEDDGTAVMSTNGDSAEGSWNAGGKLVFGNREYSFEAAEDILQISQEGSTLLFGKDGPQTEVTNVSGDSLVDIIDNVLFDISGNSLTDVLNGISGDSLTDILDYVLGDISGESLTDALGGLSGDSLNELLTRISNDPSTKVLVSISGNYLPEVLGSIPADSLTDISGSLSGDSLTELLGSLSGGSSGNMGPDIYLIEEDD